MGMRVPLSGTMSGLRRIETRTPIWSCFDGRSIEKVLPEFRQDFLALVQLFVQQFVGEQQQERQYKRKQKVHGKQRLFEERTGA